MIAFISHFGSSFLANFLLLLFPFFAGDMFATVCLLQAVVSVLKNLLEIMVDTATIPA